MEVNIINHSLVEHYLTILRDQNTKPDQFRNAANKISMLLIAEATKNISTIDKKIKTPLASYIGSEVAKESVAVPVLRAGLGLLEGVEKMLPSLSIGYIGVERNEETSKPEDYFCKLPNLDGKSIYISIFNGDECIFVGEPEDLLDKYDKNY